MMTRIWADWIGLPHELGADPRQGKGACCLLICQILLTRAGYVFPDCSPLLEQAKNRNWAALQLTFDKYTYPIQSAEINGLTLIRNGLHGLGLGIVVEENRLLFPHHKRGVIAAPIDQLRTLQYRKLRQ